MYTEMAEVQTILLSSLFTYNIDESGRILIVQQ